MNINSQEELEALERAEDVLFNMYEITKGDKQKTINILKLLIEARPQQTESEKKAIKWIKETNIWERIM